MRQLRRSSSRGYNGVLYWLRSVLVRATLLGSLLLSLGNLLLCFWRASALNLCGNQRHGRMVQGYGMMLMMMLGLLVLMPVDIRMTLLLRLLLGH